MADSTPMSVSLAAKTVAVGHLDDEEVVNVTSTACLYRRDCSGAVQLGSIAMRKSPSAVVPFVQVRKLGREQGGLERIETAVSPTQDMLEAGSLSVVANRRARAATSSSFVTTAPPSPRAPRFLVG